MGRRRQSKRAYGTKREAQAALAEVLAEHHAGTFTEPTRTLVRDYAEVWLESLVNLGRKPSTVTGYRRTLAFYVLPRIGHVTLQEMRTVDLDGLYSELIRRGGRDGRGLSLATVHQVHSIVSKMLNDAERKGLVNRNVARFADAPTLSAAQARAPELAVWTPSELRTFLESIAGNRNEALFRLLALSGLRRGEVVGLRWSDVDLRRGAVTIRQAATFVKGTEHVDAPKTRRGRRVIDLDPATVALLVRHKESQALRFDRVGRRLTPSDRVFTNDLGDPLRPDSISQAFMRLVEATDLPRIRLHDLRHTHASHLVSAGVNPKVVSERQGHASVSFTLDTYGHVLPGDQPAAGAAAAGLLS